eukprot:scaffold3108_cov152-Cylindrotheca_fusiformis.AAC.15
MEMQQGKKHAARREYQRHSNSSLSLHTAETTTGDDVSMLNLVFSNNAGSVHSPRLAVVRENNELTASPQPSSEQQESKDSIPGAFRVGGDGDVEASSSIASESSSSSDSRIVLIPRALLGSIASGSSISSDSRIILIPRALLVQSLPEDEASSTGGGRAPVVQPENGGQIVPVVQPEKTVSYERRRRPVFRCGTLFGFLLFCGLVSAVIYLSLLQKRKFVGGEATAGTEAPTSASHDDVTDRSIDNPSTTISSPTHYPTQKEDNIFDSSFSPTVAPTPGKTASSDPTAAPTRIRTPNPTPQPSPSPTQWPTAIPTRQPPRPTRRPAQRPPPNGGGGGAYGGEGGNVGDDAYFDYGGWGWGGAWNHEGGGTGGGGQGGGGGYGGRGLRS